VNAARRASAPSLATTTPLAITQTDGAEEPAVAPISRASDPATNGNGEVTAVTQRAIPARLQPDPDAS
jgi:hypothetical protein